MAYSAITRKRSILLGWLNALLLSVLLINSVVGGLASFTGENGETSVEPRTTTKVYIEPQNGTATVGELYTIAVKIANVTNLWGLDIQIRWGTAVLKYVSHTTYVGQPGGVLNPPAFLLVDEVNETSTFSKEGAAPGTTCWIAYSSLLPAVPFNGTGIVFTMTFEVLREGECDIYFTSTKLSNYGAPSQPIPHATEDGYFYQAGLGQVPVADFTFFPDPAVANKTTTFNASGSYDPDADGGISLYIWNFRDGTIENTTSPTITHSFASETLYHGYYDVSLTVLDDQGGGSQSKLTHVQVPVVHPRPVARFSVWPEDNIAVVDNPVTFNASESYDPDPGGNITEYRWNFGDGNRTNTPNPIITHKYHTPNYDGYSVWLTVLDDSDGLESLMETQYVTVVQRRDIELIGTIAAPNNVMQGKNVTVDVTVANKGEAPESFNITAYYNTTITDWIKVDETAVSDMPEQIIPEWEFLYETSPNSTVNHVLRDLVDFGYTPLSDDTRVRVGTDTGYWTLNPGLQNTAASSPTPVPGTPLTTGGWIWEKAYSGPKKLNGEFAAGDWTFWFKLYATQAGVNATVWTRLLKSSNPNPQAAEARNTVIKDWTPVFTAVEITNTTVSPQTAPNYNGSVSVPSTVFTEEYLLLEFQLQVTANSAGDAATDIIFQIGGGPFYEYKSRIAGTLFSYRSKYALSWNTEFASAGNHVVKIETSEVPQETNLTNNEGYSNDVNIVSVGHDVAVTGIDTPKTIAGQRFPLPINVTAKNYGSFSETFNVTAYANLTEIATTEITLQSGNSTTITIAWNTTDFAKGNYQITAYAWPVEEELDPDDNTLTDGQVFLTFPGDVDGDHDVDIFDIVQMAGSYGARIGDPGYITCRDIDGDGDIDIFDIVIAAGNYGKSW